MTALPQPFAKRTMFTAEEYAAESMAADYDEWIVYDPAVDNLSTWITENSPSSISREDGVGWICIAAPCRQGSEKKEMDLRALQEEWKTRQEKSEMINFEVIRQMALTHGVLHGKWLFYVPPGYKVDLAWRIVAKNMGEGNFPKCVTSAKVAPSVDSARRDATHVICVYNENFTEEDEVYELEDWLRKFGIFRDLKYKPDVYTYLGIYRNNQWGIHPTLYSSMYDVKLRRSKVVSVKNGFE